MSSPAPDESPSNDRLGRVLARLPRAGGRSSTRAGSFRRVVWAALASCFTLLVIVLVFNVVVDPFALAGTGVVQTAVENDRSIKLDLISRLETDPEILVLGSSRGRQAEPSFLQSLTGHSGFNAAVTGGTAADAWVMTRYTEHRFPTRGRRYVWFVEAGIATNGVNPLLLEDPRARRYLGGNAGMTLDSVGQYLSADATRTSLRVVRKCVVATCGSRLRYHADGSLLSSSLAFLPEHARSLQLSVDQELAEIEAHPPKGGKLNPKWFVNFEKTIAFMNEHGSRPVIVINPVHPTVLAALQRYGNPVRTRSAAYLTALHRKLDFVVVDCHDISTWGGSPDDFANATHVNRRNMQRMLRYVVAHSDGALD